jgi:hypothetical protein
MKYQIINIKKNCIEVYVESWGLCLASLHSIFFISQITYHWLVNYIIWCHAGKETLWHLQRANKYISFKLSFHFRWGLEYICKTQIDVQSLIDVQSSNRRPILKDMAVFHFLKSTSNYVTDVYFKWRHTRLDMVLKQWWRRDKTRFRVHCTSTLSGP